MLSRAEPRGSSDGRRRQDSDVDCIHPSFVPSALNRFLAMSIESRPVGGRRCDIVAYREIRCDTFVQKYQFNNPLREENVLVYLRLRFRRLSGWIVVVVAAAALHEDYLSPRGEYQRHHPPAPSSAEAYWPAVWEVGDGHWDALWDSSVKRGLRLPTMWMKTTRSHWPQVSRVAGGLRYREAGDGPPACSGKQLLRMVGEVR
jgi:hypothetical protein